MIFMILYLITLALWPLTEIVQRIVRSTRYLEDLDRRERNRIPLPLVWAGILAIAITFCGLVFFDKTHSVLIAGALLYLILSLLAPIRALRPRAG